ncbi:hypothetical protein LTR22_027809, partial [Elasticomyces elasticus]
MAEYEATPPVAPTPSPKPQAPRQPSNSLASRFFGEHFVDVSDGDDELPSVPSIDDQLREYLQDRSHHNFTWPEFVPVSNGGLDANCQPAQLAVCCRKGITKDDPPIRFWLDNQQRWPQLAAMALNVYSTPTMSDDPERVFSEAGT